MTQADLPQSLPAFQCDLAEKMVPYPFRCGLSMPIVCVLACVCVCGGVDQQTRRGRSTQSQGMQREAGRRTMAS